jgi:hypothetical protein
MATNEETKGVHVISKTTELPTGKGKAYWFATEEEARAQAGEDDAYLWSVKGGFYLFVTEETGMQW